MDVTELPFNRLIGLEPAAPDSGFLVSLPAGTQYANHLGTVHAVALLAEAGAFLASQAGMGLLSSLRGEVTFGIVVLMHFPLQNLCEIVFAGNRRTSLS